jgi:hypothetical protein
VTSTTPRLLFLDPDGVSVKRRNREEGHEDGHLSSWSYGNFNIMKRLREDVDPGAAERVQLRMYDETIRFNLMFIDNQLGVMQTYLPALRGLDAPTFVMRQSGEREATCTPSTPTSSPHSGNEAHPCDRPTPTPRRRD